MNLSQNALDLIKGFESLRLEAYRDPVGIPTIGYGTIRYPDGRRVAMGDSISEEQAEAFLRFECERTSQDVLSATNGVALSQNQFDALVSFCYNVGYGAFAESSLLRKLRSSDVQGASSEFPRWNKGTVRGIKKELRGLTRRRAKERRLFDNPDTVLAEMPPPIAVSKEEKVTRAIGFRSDGANVVVAFDADGDVVEILELANSVPDTLLAMLKVYPNLQVFDFADAGTNVPPGSRVRFAGSARPIVKVPDAPTLERALLTLGMEDEEGTGDDIKQLQARLQELGYYRGEVSGIFDQWTDAAARDFQADYFGHSEADGRVGPKTWAMLWGQSEPIRPPVGDAPSPGRHYLLLTKTNDKDQFGLTDLLLSHFRDGVFSGSITVCSGQSRRQMFRAGPDSPVGSMEPLPEGEWRLHDIEWAAGKDNYNGAVWNKALGPAKIRLDYLRPGRTARSAIEIHIDWNRAAGAPGTAGCIGVRNVADFRRLVGWLRETNPRSLFVDWGLGSCPAQ